MYDAFWERSQDCEKRLLASSCLSVCLSVRPWAWNNSASTGRIFMKLDTFEYFFENPSGKFTFH